MMTAPKSLSACGRSSGFCCLALNQWAVSPVSWMSRTKAVTGAPRCHMMSLGSQALMLWPRRWASRIMTKVVSL